MGQDRFGALVTAPIFETCAACNEGAMIHDPQTGDERCGNCSARRDFAPLVKGGQGREAGELEGDATGTAWLVIGVIVAVAIVAALAVR